MADLLLELFSEEIPARMQADALAHVQKTFTEQLQKEGLAPESTQGFVTPRRVAIIIRGLATSQPASETELKGPKVGAPDAAMQGFLKKNNIQQSDLTERDGVTFAMVRKEGKHTADVLKAIIETMLAQFPWPKSMRWGSNDETWVRPLHSILCIFDGKTIPVTFGTVTAGNTTRGHRFLSPDTITLTNPADYETALEKAHVLADRAKRKAHILAQAEKAATTQKLALKKDEGLLEEVTGLVEWPIVLVGTIDAKYMDLPKEVLVSEMRAHQKYFALENADGSLSDKFLITANMQTQDGGKAVIAGNERVLRARLSDGRFFWDQDRKKTLAAWGEGLKTVTYHAKLGSIADKVARIETLALQLADHVKGADKKHVQQAARLCKADLVTGMVGEFPELQGVMGRYYAQDQGADIADAIRDHYKPQGPGDSVPTAPTSVCVALADKLDTLISMFAIGEKPTGSKDPFALRRAALGVIRIILENNLRLALSSVTPSNDGVRTPQPVRGDNELVAFFMDRLKVQLKDQGIRHDVINAVVADGDDDLVRIVARAKALQDFLATDDGKNLLIGYKRAANILAIEEKKDKTTYAAATLDPLLLKEPEEKALMYLRDPKFLDKLEEFQKNEQFVDSMKWFSTLRGPIDQFFDKVLVNDPQYRINRLSMLAAIRDKMDSIANFALIEG
jgi:glycyl-tRNA synthetase beta chain